MTPPRAASGLLVAALIRRIEAEGGHAMVIARGEPGAGALLIELIDRGSPGVLLERHFDGGGYVWAETGPGDPADRPAYLDRRRRADRDLWVVELDHPRARDIALDLLADPDRP